MAERQSALMSKITNDGLTRSRTGWLIAVPIPYGNSGRQRVQWVELTEDDACHGRRQPELLLEVFGSESYASVDENGIERAVEHSEHVGTVHDERLDRLDDTSQSAGAQVQRWLVVCLRLGVHRLVWRCLFTMMFWK